MGLLGGGWALPCTSLGGAAGRSTARGRAGTAAGSTAPPPGPRRARVCPRTRPARGLPFLIPPCHQDVVTGQGTWDPKGTPTTTTTKISRKTPTRQASGYPKFDHTLGRAWNGRTFAGFQTFLPRTMMERASRSHRKPLQETGHLGLRVAEDLPHQRWGMHRAEVICGGGGWRRE